MSEDNSHARIDHAPNHNALKPACPRLMPFIFKIVALVIALSVIGAFFAALLWTALDPHHANWNSESANHAFVETFRIDIGGFLFLGALIAVPLILKVRLSERTLYIAAPFVGAALIVALTSYLVASCGMESSLFAPVSLFKGMAMGLIATWAVLHVRSKEKRPELPNGDRNHAEHEQ